MDIVEQVVTEIEELAKCGVKVSNGAIAFAESDEGKAFIDGLDQNGAGIDEIADIIIMTR